MISALDISTSALVAQRIRLNAIASNLANMSTTRNENGEIEPFRARYAVFQQDLTATPVMDDLAATNSGVNGVQVSSGTLSGAGHWSFGGLVGYLGGNVAIDASGELTIDPGQIVKMVTGVYFSVSGALEAVGTESEPIVFTSYRDDSRGGDTNNDGPSEAVAGDWECIYTGGDSTIELTHFEVHYAGNYYHPGNFFVFSNIF